MEPESCHLESSIVKQKCQFSCADHKNFKLIGSKSVKCKKNGTWRQKGGNPMCVEKKKKSKKKRKKKHKNQHLGHPLSTVGLPPNSSIKTSASSSTSTTSSTTTSTTMPPWPSTTPWYQMPQTSPTPTRSSSLTTTTTARPTPTPWSTQPSRPPRPLPTTSIPYYHQITPVFPAPFIYCPPDVIKDLPSLSGKKKCLKKIELVLAKKNQASHSALKLEKVQKSIT